MKSVSQSSRPAQYRRGPHGRARAHKCPLASICVAVASLLVLFTPAKTYCAQTAETLSQAKRVYVGSLGDKQGATALHDKLILRLRKTREIELVATPSQADAIISGSGEIWLKGYINTNAKPSPANRQPVYGGYLSVELKGKDNETLWSCLVTPGMFRWNSVTQDLVNKSVKKLASALHPHGVRSD